MTDDAFKKNVAEILPLVMNYGVNSFELSGCKNPEELFQRVTPRAFRNKIHEGFKSAQKHILSALLSIEDEMKTEEAKLKLHKRGKKKSEWKDAAYREMEKTLGKLRFQQAAFKEIANAIAWQIYHLGSTHIKGLMKKDMGHGYLRDKNIQSVLSAAEHVNQDEDSFALITDITSCLGIGDIIMLDKRGKHIVEVKEGKVNDIILDATHGDSPENPEKRMEDMIKRLHAAAGEGGIRQAERFFRQMHSMAEAQRYIHTDRGTDQMTGMPKIAWDIAAPTQSLVEKVNDAIDELDAGKEWMTLVPGDCLIVGIRKRKAGESDWVCHMDFKHFVYHATQVPWGDCQYGKEAEELHLTKDNPVELMRYHDIPTFPLSEKVSIPTHLPLPFLFSTKNVISLLTGKIGIYVYFMPDIFFKMCEAAGLSPRWISEQEYQKSFGSEGKKGFTPAAFPSGYLVYGGNDGGVVFGYGLLYRMLYELQTGASLIAQMKEVADAVKNKKVMAEPPKN